MLLENTPPILGETHLLNVSVIKFIAHMANEVFGSVAELKKFVNDHRDKDYNVFDFDWSEADDATRYKYMLLVFMDAKDNSEHSNSAKMKDFVAESYMKPDSKFMRMFDDEENCDVIDELWRRVQCMWISLVAAHNPSYRTISMTHPGLKLLVNSCDPNVCYHSNRKEIVLTVIHPIKAGSEIRKSGQPFYRKRDLKCMSSHPQSCEPCQNGWTRELGAKINSDNTSNTLKFFAQHDPKKLTSQLKYLKSCADFINKNFDGFHTDAMKRCLVATKMYELEGILFNIGNPFPYSNLYFSLQQSDGLEKLQQFMKIMHFDSKLPSNFFSYPNIPSYA